MQEKKTTGMSEVLLVKLESLDSLFRASTSGDTPSFEVWEDRDGVDLFWTGRRVEKVYSEHASGRRWWSVPVPNAARSLLRRKKAKRVKFMPAPEGGLPS